MNVIVTEGSRPGSMVPVKLPVPCTPNLSVPSVNVPLMSKLPEISPPNWVKITLRSAARSTPWVLLAMAPV